MSDAFFYNGSDFECDVSGLLTIDGQLIPVRRVDEWVEALGAPHLKANSVPELARLVIDASPERRQIEKTKEEHWEILRDGDSVTRWNEWRNQNPQVRPTLYGLDLRPTALGKDLARANFSYADLRMAQLSNANLIEANFHQAILARADLRDADLTGANLCRADLYETILSGAKLTNANLQGAQLAKTCFERADLTRCKVYGMSAWDLNLKDAKQDELIIRYRFRGTGDQPESAHETEILVEDLQVAQFVYLLLSNQNVRSAIDTITSKVVLILGRFAEARKGILDALREALRKKNLVPIIFDFGIPTNRNVTETVRIIAGLAKFIVADITHATEVRAELHRIVPDFPSLPIQPIILAGSSEFISLRELQRYPWVLETFEYRDVRHLLESLDQCVIGPAVARQRELVGQDLGIAKLPTKLREE